jgi:hypothetical protein
MNHRPLLLLVGVFCVSGALHAQREVSAREHLLEIISVLQKEWLHRNTMTGKCFSNVFSPTPVPPRLFRMQVVQSDSP